MVQSCSSRALAFRRFVVLTGPVPGYPESLGAWVWKPDGKRLGSSPVIMMNGETQDDILAQGGSPAGFLRDLVREGLEGVPEHEIEFTSAKRITHNE